MTEAKKKTSKKLVYFDFSGMGVSILAQDRKEAEKLAKKQYPELFAKSNKKVDKKLDLDKDGDVDSTDYTIAAKTLNHAKDK